MRTHLATGLALGLLALVAGVGGCSAADDPSVTNEEVATQGEPLATYDYPLVYTAHRETGPCLHHPCGAWLVQQVNVAAPPTRVVRLDLAPVRLTDGMLAAVEGAPVGDLLLRGGIAGPGRTPMSRVFVATDAYLGMPGVPRAPEGDAYYAIRCENEACARMEAYLVDTPVVHGIDAVDVSRAARPFVDRAWLEGRVKHHGALVTGHIVPGPIAASGAPRRVLEASQVYVRLRDATGPCLLPFVTCREPLRPAYTLDANLCLAFEACVSPRTCAFTPALATCEDGYVSRTWATGGDGCWAFACEPAFLTAE